MQKPRRKGWFAIPGVQAGDRTVEEQTQGLDPLRAQLPGRSVLDLGCAEGLIARAVLDWGAARVLGLDYNASFVRQAQILVPDERARFAVHDLSQCSSVFAKDCQADIVLALAVIHKLGDPTTGLMRWAAMARQRFVIRLPIGSDGAFASKYNPRARCDTRIILPAQGFALEHDLEGPRGERVQHWLRKGGA